MPAVAAAYLKSATLLLALIRVDATASSCTKLPDGDRQCLPSDTLYTGGCPPFQKKNECWSSITKQEFLPGGWSYQSYSSACCGEKDSDCCETDGGAVAGMTIFALFAVAAAGFGVFACIFLACCASCPCNKHHASKANQAAMQTPAQPQPTPAVMVQPMPSAAQPMAQPMAQQMQAAKHMAPQMTPQVAQPVAQQAPKVQVATLVVDAV
mmetsp:Transcript_21236/g.54390  ORF Transcript_21236/g.54390 Transcript_21236/m.54390 type:complete len:210 (+) Transcript_21236:672-1301(+)|eukprot:CAMPEP_0115847188 /NCGR_PEP_ID=MMETSP0287-20121206/10255_1 /TAXON_ID=412157 /ORGANISM="Chrysochromulina rotalis, Strain UIO044" /LENGTH=209 /DNA_ID=CAMNT_0003301017 /DNA_START=848 /DNA_END=1477 /DNA_ORIENTATION=+